MALSFLEHHEHGPAGGAGGDKTDAPGGKRQHRDNLIIIAGTFGVLIVTYLVYRSSKANASSAPVARPSASYPAAGTVAGGATGGSAGDASYMQQIAQQVQSSLSANQQAQAQAQAGFAQYLDQLTAHLVEMNQPSSPTASTNPPPGSSTGPNGWKLVYTPGMGAGVDTGQRNVSSGPVGGAPSPDFVNFRAQQPADVQHFLDSVGSGQVVVQQGVVYGHT